MDTVKAAWHRKQVVSALFLDIEGAFPNAVTEWLLHNLRKRRIPERYVVLISSMLTGRKNRLKFDDFTSNWFPLDNGIVQGDPLSMILYLFYNADLLEIARGRCEMCLGYVDDMALVTMASSFAETHRLLNSMVSRSGGAREWSISHNSKFEASKSILIDFSCTKGVEQPAMTFQGCTVTAQASHRFLGVIVDQGLCWRQHADFALTKAAKWTSAFRRLARPSTGVSLRLMRQMYCAVALPKMTYAADVWYTPTRKKEGAKKTSGSVGIMKRLASVQRMGSTAITGALGTTPTDLLDLHAGLWPVHLMLYRICHWAATRLALLPVLHPLYKLYRIQAKCYIKMHRSPLHELAASYSIAPERMETQDPDRLPLAYEVKARITLVGQDEEQDRGGALGDGEVELYSDGLGLDGMVGAAAVMFKGAQGAKTLRYSLGQLTEHTVYEAEAVGVILALHMLGL